MVEATGYTIEQLVAEQTYFAMVAKVWSAGVRYGRLLSAREGEEPSYGWYDDFGKKIPAPFHPQSGDHSCDGSWMDTTKLIFVGELWPFM